uniref:CMP/dCMP-type deaminase domain-containing protein n=1 Tax=Heterorhabditis bacteriophora TaxID=37862 RepID=A0A1I7X2T1_HETBA
MLWVFVSSTNHLRQMLSKNKLDDDHAAKLIPFHRNATAGGISNRNYYRKTMYGVHASSPRGSLSRCAVRPWWAVWSRCSQRWKNHRFRTQHVEYTFDLTGCELYTSCYPCPMCLGACLWAHFDSIYYAASAEQAAAIGFDDKAFHDFLKNPGTDQYR